MRAIVFLGLIGLVFPCLSQFDFGTYFRSAATDPEIRVIQSQEDYLQNENFNLPWFRGADFRLRTNDANATPEDYRFRLELLNPFERAANKAFNKSYEKNLAINKTQEYSRLLFVRYQLLTSSFRLNLEVGRLKAAEDRLLEFQSLAQANGDAAKILKIDLQITKNIIEREQKQGELESVNEQIRKLSSLSVAPDWNEFEIINPATMWRIISMVDTLEMPLVKAINSEIDLAHKEYKLDKTNAHRAVGFIQTEYDSDRGNMPEEHWGFQIGIGIPLFNSDRPNLQYSRLELMQIESESAKILVEFQTELDRLKMDFQIKKSNWEGLAEKIYGTYDNLESNDLGLLLEVFDYQEELARMGFTLHMDLINIYLQILFMQGRMSEKVPVNFLSWSLAEY